MSDQPVAAFSLPVLHEDEFRDLSAVLGAHLGFRFASGKKTMLAGRLAPRIRMLGLSGYGEYASLLKENLLELQVAVDLVTTNETRFFREEEHFQFLEKAVFPRLQHLDRPLRFWSAACSSGQEPYSLAMCLADYFGMNVDWHIWASDVSEKVLEKARRGLYPICDAVLIPESKKKGILFARESGV